VHRTNTERHLEMSIWPSCRRCYVS
jgi:hypothetical protein